MSHILLVTILGALAATIAVLHVVALAFYFYWTLWWFDVLQHFLAGFWIVLLTFWIVFRLRPSFISPFINTPATFLILALIGAFAVGLGWEIFEYTIQVYFAENYVFDTISDLAMDVIGAFAGYIYIMNSRFKLVFS